jgi:hypothetical protein
MSLNIPHDEQIALLLGDFHSWTNSSFIYNVLALTAEMSHFATVRNRWGRR